MHRCNRIAELKRGIRDAFASLRPEFRNNALFAYQDRLHQSIANGGDHVEVEVIQE
jgi:hypothetical protein